MLCDLSQETYILGTLIPSSEKLMSFKWVNSNVPWNLIIWNHKYVDTTSKQLKLQRQQHWVFHNSVIEFLGREGEGFDYSGKLRVLYLKVLLVV